MHAISVKELRSKLPVIRTELKKGESFLVIYKSKPIAELTPVADLSDVEFATEDEIEAAAVSEWDDEYLSGEELNYYMRLKD